LLAALAAPVGMAQEDRRPVSAECRQALDALEAQEAAALAAQDRREAVKQVQALRRRAARACLGGSGEPPPLTSRFVQPAPGVVPPSAQRPPAPPRAMPAAPPPMPAPQRPPPVITACDAAGCWTSDGSRVDRQGPLLFGPHGLCTLQGVTLHCP